LQSPDKRKSWETSFPTGKSEWGKKLPSEGGKLRKWTKKGRDLWSTLKVPLVREKRQLQNWGRRQASTAWGLTKGELKKKKEKKKETAWLKIQAKRSCLTRGTTRGGIPGYGEKKVYRTGEIKGHPEHFTEVLQRGRRTKWSRQLTGGQALHKDSKKETSPLSSTTTPLPRNTGENRNPNHSRTFFLQTGRET